MAVLDLADNDEYYIYADPKDVRFVNLKDSLNLITKLFSDNSLGFSFYVEQVPGYPNIYQKRNDVLIALKALNPKFFRDYSAAYLNNVSQKHSRYVKPTTDREAQELANTITNQTQNNLFQVKLTRPMPTVKAMFGDYTELCPIVHCLALLPHERMIDHACTWLPRGDLSDELKEFRLLGLTPKPVILSSSKVAEDGQNTKKSAAKTNGSGFKKGFLL